jgi:hypothetical protein
MKEGQQEYFSGDWEEPGGCFMPAEEHSGVCSAF